MNLCSRDQTESSTNEWVGAPHSLDFKKARVLTYEVIDARIT